MRLFIAIRLNNEMRNALTEMQESMQKQGVTGNFTRSENMHLTLAFIGEYPDPDDVAEVMEQVDFEPFSIRLSDIGSFKGLWWAGISKSNELEALVRRLRHALAEAGIPFDRKKFSPHITLIRKPLCRNGKRLPELLDEIPEAAMTVDRISLMRSDRGKHGMVYTEMFSVAGERM